MHNSRHWQYRLCLMLVVFIASCLPNPQTKHPLSDPQEARLDKRLLGRWSPGGKNHIIIGKATGRNVPPGIMKAETFGYFTDSKGKTNVERHAYFFFSTTIDKRHYANIFECKSLMQKEPQWGKIDSFGFIKYTVSGNKLTWVYASEKFVKDAVTKKQLQGDVWHGSTRLFPTPGGVGITDSSANLRKFVAGEDARLFDGKAAVFHREK